MATGKSTIQVLRHSMLALLIAATSAWGMGNSPPEGRAPQAASASCPDQKSGPCGPGAPPEGGSTPSAARSDDPSNPDAKSRTSRSDRYGTGYETRKGLGSGGGGGRGRGGRGR